MDELKRSDSFPRSAGPVSIPPRLRALETPLRFIKGVGPKRATQLAAWGLDTVEDLLYHLPFRYEDRRQIKKCREAIIGEAGSFVGQLIALQKRFDPRRRTHIMNAVLRDDTGSISLVWYRAPGYLADALRTGQRLLVHGRVEQGAGGQKRVAHPEFDILESCEERELQEILPVYVRPAGVPLALLRKWISWALAEYGPLLPETLPAATLHRRGLMTLRQALVDLHQPGRDVDAAELNNFSSRAHRSIVFEEIFYLQLGLAFRKQQRTRSGAVVLGAAEKPHTATMRSLLPFQLTAAQERVLAEIRRDIESSQSMQRLVQGDVGSGKTMVAWFASLHVIERGRQVVWMAPTELLAEQHYGGLHRFSERLGITSALLTGTLPVKKRQQVLAALGRGEIEFLVGTHALIQQGVSVPRMGLGVVDEQHRFGVLQRLSLQRLAGQQPAGLGLGQEPHLLLMSATPIPRSLAMVLYGDMEVSFLDEMPPGRRPVLTRVYNEHQRREVYAKVIGELGRGHQAFIVYPLVEASDQLQHVRDASRMAERMRAGAFRHFNVGLLHGRMSAEERDAAMRSFRDGRVQILVCTTVIEVGIDIPNATIMVVEHAERFGLSQLHQLRGRVGRGTAPGYCLLVNRAPQNPVANERVRVMEQEPDGFKIAEADLALRGPGELLGTRQSGLGDFRAANLVRDARILAEAREEAETLLKSDPDLNSMTSAQIKAVLLHRWGKKLQLGAVG